MREEIWDTAEQSALLRLMSRLGRPPLRYVSGSEGNASVKSADGKRMLIKATGTSFLEPGLAVVDLEKAARLVDMELGEQETRHYVGQMTLSGRTLPSREVSFHSVLRKHRWVVHTHPSGVCSFVCSKAAGRSRLRKVYLDRVQELSGSVFAWVPYAEAGVPLAREVRRALEIHRLRREEPEAFILQNHGMIVCSSDPESAEEMTTGYASAFDTMVLELGDEIPRTLLEFREEKAMPEYSITVLLEVAQEMGYSRSRLPAPGSLLRNQCLSRRGCGLRRVITPEQAIQLGPTPLWLRLEGSEYTMRRVARKAIQQYAQEHGRTSFLIHVEGFGCIALAGSDRESSLVIDVAERTLDLIRSTWAFGGPLYLPTRQRREVE